MAHVLEESSSLDTPGRRPAPTDRRAGTVAHYVNAFAAFDETAASRQPTWLTEARRAALARFAGLGFPTTRHEAWRFTPVGPVADRPATLVAAPERRAVEDLADAGLAEAGVTIVVTDGRVSRVQADPHAAAGSESVVVTSLRDAWRDHPGLVEGHLTRLAADESAPFVALNTAFLDEGAFLHVPARAIVDAPVHVVFVSTGQAEPWAISHPRLLIAIGERSEARIVESYVSGGDRPYVTNGVTEVSVGAGAIVDHYKVIREHEDACHVAGMYVRLDRDSRFASHALTLEGELVRNDVMARLGGQGGECTLNGLYLAGGTAFVDNHTTIDHALPHCDSHELYKGVLWGRARAVFNGKIIVREDAQKTDAKQTNKALLLSDDAQVNTKPELEIFADDVKCTHGAAIGQLDEDAIFYLRSRGLGVDEARDLLIHAFAGDIVHRIQVPSLRERLETTLLTRLPGRAQAPS